MILSKVLMGRVIRFGNVTGPTGAQIYGRNLVRHCEKRYGFLQVPRDLSDFNYETGVTFLHGFFRNMVIAQLQIFNTGIVAESNVETDYANDFIDDAIESLTSAGILRIEPEKAERSFYLSELEVTTHFMLESAFIQFSEFGEQIGNCVSSYGQSVPSFAFGSFALIPFGGVPPFKFENRINAPAGTYFSSAPLQTGHHLRFLDRLEALLTKTTAS